MRDRTSTNERDQQPRTTVTTSPTILADDDLLPIGEIKKIAGIGKTMIYRLERAGSFPQRYKPGGYASRWSRREVMDWRERQRGTAAAPATRR